jgi:hypothetical protein
MKNMPKTLPLCASFVLACLASSSLFAQTGPDLLIKPWGKDAQIEAKGDASWIWDGHTSNNKANGDSFDYALQQYDLNARFRVNLGGVIPARAEPRVGLNVTYMNLNSGDPSLPSDMLDTSAAFGMGFYEQNGWIGGFSVGLGYASVAPFGDGNGWYGKADVAFGHTIDDTSEIGIVIDYDGNRTFMPDVPIPGVQYRKRLYSKQLLVAVGFPYDSIEWQINDQLKFTAQYEFPDSLTGDLTYDVTKDVGIFAAVSDRAEAFHWDAIPNDRDRLIFQQTKVEAGVKVTPLEGLSFSGSVGYAWNQEFSSGWDNRKTDLVADLSDEPFVHVGVEFRY